MTKGALTCRYIRGVAIKAVLGAFGARLLWRQSVILGTIAALTCRYILGVAVITALGAFEALFLSSVNTERLR